MYVRPSPFYSGRLSPDGDGSGLIYGIQLVRKRHSQNTQHHHLSLQPNLHPTPDWPSCCANALMATPVRHQREHPQPKAGASRPARRFKGESPPTMPHPWATAHHITRTVRWRQPTRGKGKRPTRESPPTTPHPSATAQCTCGRDRKRGGGWGGVLLLPP